MGASAHLGHSEVKKMGKDCHNLPNCPYLPNCLHPGATAGHSFYCVNTVLTCSGPLGQDFVLSFNLSSPLALQIWTSHLSSIVPDGVAVIILGEPY